MHTYVRVRSTVSSRVGAGVRGVLYITFLLMKGAGPSSVAVAVVAVVEILVLLLLLLLRPEPLSS